MFEVNNSLCINCGKCIKICPVKVLAFNSDTNPEMTSKGLSCFKCMHCVSICPKEAITFSDTPESNKKAVLPNDETYEDLKNIISTRRSIRNFKQDSVSLNDIQEILHITDFAPSAKNQHPHEWILIHDTSLVKEIMNLVLEFAKENNIALEVVSEYETGNNIVTMNAPHLLFGCGPKEGAINPYTDTTIVLTQVDLLLHSKKLGACWAGYLTRITNANSKIRQLIGLDDSMQVYGALAFGVPNNESYERLPYRNYAKFTIK